MSTDLQQAFNEVHAKLKDVTNLLNLTRLVMDKASRDEAGEIVADTIAIVNRTEKFVKEEA